MKFPTHDEDQPLHNLYSACLGCYQENATALQETVEILRRMSISVGAMKETPETYGLKKIWREQTQPQLKKLAASD